MKFWKKTGWFLLGCCPTVAVLFWQILISSVAMYVILFQQMAGMDRVEMNSPEYYRLLESVDEQLLSGSNYGILMFIIYVGYQVIFGLWYYFMFCHKRQTGDWKQVLKPSRAIGIIACGFFMQLSLTMLLSAILPLFPEILESYSDIMNTLGDETIFMVLCVCILAPIGEELIFRGLTLRIMRKAFPWQVAVIIQAVLFGVYHMNLVQGIYATLLGLFMGYLAYRYNSVVPGILLHMTINSLSYVIEYFIPPAMGESILMMLVIGVCTLVISMGFIYRVTRDVVPVEPRATDSQNIPSN